MTSLSVPPLLADAVAAMPSTAATPQVRALEEELAAAYCIGHAVAVSSGTAALQTALVAAGIGEGDEVLVAGAAVPATIAAIVHTRARPVFLDAPPDPFGGWVDVADAAAKLSPPVKAILPVHLAGRVGDLRGLIELADDAGVPVIEDACQAQGTLLDGATAGTIGQIGCFSLKDGKIVTSGEGGYLLTDDAGIAATARAFRTHWQLDAPGHLAGSRVGHNLRLAEPLAALARHSLADQGEAVDRRRAQTGLLHELVDVPGLTPIPTAPGEEPNGFAALWLIGLPEPRAFAERLARLGVVNSTGAFGLRCAADLAWVAPFDPVACPRATGLLDRLLAVPVLPTATDEDLTALAALISKEAAGWSRS